MKRLLSMILCILMLVSAVPAMAVMADEPAAKAFDDVKPGKWYYEGVMWCAEQGYMAGESETLFAPSKEMTRSMLVTVLAAIAGVDTSADEYKHSPFVDVKDGKWYTGAVVWANNNGIATGISDDTFGYKNAVTREQLVLMVYKFMQMQGVDVSKVNENKYNACGDTKDVHSWAVEAMKWALDNEIISGTGTVNGAAQISPRTTATRAQIAVIVKAMLEKNLGGEHPVGSLTLGGSDISEFAIVYGQTNKYNWRSNIHDITAYLQTHIAAATGVTLPIYADTELPAVKGAKEILIGKTNREDAGFVTVDREGLVGDALLYEMQGSYLILASNEEEVGTYLAANRFLEDTIGFTDFGNSIFAYTSIASATLEDGVRVVDAPYMELIVNSQRGGWDAFMCPSESAYTFVNVVHSLPLLCCSGCEGGSSPLEWDHHVYHHMGPDDCLSDSQTIKTVLENTRTVAANSDGKLVWLSQSDGEEFCKCNDCANIYRTFGRCATYVQLLNYVATELADEFPDKKFVGLAYKYTMVPPNLPEEVTDEDYAKFLEVYTDEEIVPPQDITSPENVVMCVCTDKSCYSHSITDPDCKNKSHSNVKYKSNFEQWCEIIPTIYVWDYLTASMYDHTPFPNIHSIYDNYTFFYEMGVTGMYPLGISEPYGDFGDLRTYLLSEYAMDSDISETEYWQMVDNFLEAYYGDGYTYVREYIEQIEALSDKNEFHNWLTSWWNNVITEEDWDANYDYLRSLWEKALQYAETDDEILHVKQTMTQILYVELQMAYHDYEESRKTEDLDYFRELNHKYVAHLDEVGFKRPVNWAESMNPDNWQK